MTKKHNTHTRKSGVISPSDLAAEYDEVYQLAQDHPARSPSISAALHNALGLLRRIPGQLHYRAAPNGKIDAPSERELLLLRQKLKLLKATLTAVPGSRKQVVQA